MRAIARMLALCGALAAGGALAQPAPDAYTAIRGTGVRLEVPEGFRVSTEFPGIGRDEDLSSLLVTELHVPISVSRQTFDAESLALRGIRVDRIAPVTVDGRAAWLAHATQDAAGVSFRKWILLFGDDTHSVMLTATTPLDLEAVHQRARVDTLRSARWSPGGAADESPDFRVEETPPLRIVRSSGNALVLSDPAPRPEGRLAPLVTVGESRAQVQIRDLAAFARRRLEESVTLEAIEILSEEARPLDGMPGHWIRARAEDAQSAREVEVMQLLATDGARYYLVQGVVDAEASQGFESLLDRVIASFTRAPR